MTAPSSSERGPVARVSVVACLSALSTFTESVWICCTEPVNDHPVRDTAATYEGSEEASSSGREGRHVVVERRDACREDVDVRNDRGRRARSDDRGERGSSSSEDGDDGTGETHGGLSSKDSERTA